MRVIYKEPGKEAEVRNISNDLETLQSLVGGYIEHLTLSPGRLGLIVNEEGKLHDMECNFPVKHDMIVGPAVFVGEGGEDFTDVSDEDAMLVMEYLRWNADGILGDLK